MALLQQGDLQIGIDIGQENVLGIAQVLRNGGSEIGKDVQLRVQCLCHVEVVTVATGPEECLALYDLQAAQIDVSGLEKVDMLRREIGAHNAHHAYLIV